MNRISQPTAEVNNRIVLRVHKCDVVSPNLIGTVRVTPEAETVIKQLQRETGLSARSIVSQIIVQAADMIDISEV